MRATLTERLVSRMANGATPFLRCDDDHEDDDDDDNVDDDDDEMCRMKFAESSPTFGLRVKPLMERGVTTELFAPKYAL